MTSSSKYFGDAGRTRPARRLMTMRRKPSARTPRRGLIKARTSGRSFQSNLALGFAAGAAAPAAVAMPILSAVLIPRVNCLDLVLDERAETGMLNTFMPD